MVIKTLMLDRNHLDVSLTPSVIYPNLWLMWHQCLRPRPSLSRKEELTLITCLCHLHEADRPTSASLSYLVTSVFRDWSAGERLSDEPVSNLIKVQVHARAPFPSSVPIAGGPAPGGTRLRLGYDGRANLFARVRGESKVQKILIATQISQQHPSCFQKKKKNNWGLSGRICRNLPVSQDVYTKAIFLSMS